ncbi:MAG: hypothetical protein ABR584_01485 [Candidatus Baltobacteraceae bacterium]
MKYVCTFCGLQLRIDHDIDDERTITGAIAEHRAYACPGTLDAASDAPAVRLRN